MPGSFHLDMSFYLSPGCNELPRKFLCLLILRADTHYSSSRSSATTASFEQKWEGLKQSSSSKSIFPISHLDNNCFQVHFCILHALTQLGTLMLLLLLLKQLSVAQVLGSGSIVHVSSGLRSESVYFLNSRVPVSIFVKRYQFSYCAEFL